MPENALVYKGNKITEQCLFLFTEAWGVIELPLDDLILVIGIKQCDRASDNTKDDCIPRGYFCCQEEKINCRKCNSNVDDPAQAGNVPRGAPNSLSSELPDFLPVHVFDGEFFSIADRRAINIEKWFVFTVKHVHLVLGDQQLTYHIEAAKYGINDRRVNVASFLRVEEEPDEKGQREHNQQCLFSIL